MDLVISVSIPYLVLITQTIIEKKLKENKYLKGLNPLFGFNYSNDGGTSEKNSQRRRRVSIPYLVLITQTKVSALGLQEVYCSRLNPLFGFNYSNS